MSQFVDTMQTGFFFCYMLDTDEYVSFKIYYTGREQLLSAKLRL